MRAQSDLLPSREPRNPPFFTRLWPASYLKVRERANQFSKHRWNTHDDDLHPHPTKLSPSRVRKLKLSSQRVCVLDRDDEATCANHSSITSMVAFSPLHAPQTVRSLIRFISALLRTRGAGPEDVKSARASHNPGLTSRAYSRQ